MTAVMGRITGATVVRRNSTRTGALQRDRHQPDYAILIAVVALTAIGVLMVYSSSAIKAYLGPNNDSFAVVGPQVVWAALGFLAMGVMIRLDYRYLRLISVPLYIVALVLLLLVFVPSLNHVVGGSARFLQIGPLPAVHPAEIG